MPTLNDKPVVFPPRQRTGRISWPLFKGGKQYRLVAGVDFTSNSGSVRSSAIQAAKRMGMRARTMKDGEDLIVQFFPIENPSKPLKRSKATTKKQTKG